MVVWKGTDGMVAPEKRECETFGYPEHDSAGEVMYCNTHFLTEGQAWESIRASVEAGINLAGEDVDTAQRALRRAEQRAGDAAILYCKAIRGYRSFKSVTADEKGTR